MNANLGKQLFLPTFPELPSAAGKRAIVTDRICLTVGILFLVYSLLEAIDSQFVMAWFDAAFALMLLACIALNRHGFQYLAAWGAIVIGAFSQLAFSSYMGPGAGAHTIFVPLVGFPLLVFDPRRKISIAIATLLPMACYGFLLATDFSPPGWRWKADVPDWYKWAVPAASFIVSFLMLFHLFRAQQLAEERLHEEQTKRFAASKLAALGEMAGGVAHEINNPLAAIQLMANQISLRAGKTPLDTTAVARLAGQIVETVARISKITRAMQIISRSGPEMAAPSLCKVSEIFENTAMLCRERFAKNGIQFEIKLPPKKLLVRCDQGQISHALLNLLNNACDAVENLDMAAPPWIRLEAKDSGSEI